MAASRGNGEVDVAASSSPAGDEDDGDADESKVLRTVADIDAEIARLNDDVKRLEDAAKARRELLADPVEGSRRRYQHRLAMGEWLETRRLSPEFLDQIAAFLRDDQHWTLTDADALDANGWRVDDEGYWLLDRAAAPSIVSEPEEPE